MPALQGLWSLHPVCLVTCPHFLPHCDPSPSYQPVSLFSLFNFPQGLCLTPVPCVLTSILPSDFGTIPYRSSPGPQTAFDPLLNTLQLLHSRWYPLVPFTVYILEYMINVCFFNENKVRNRVKKDFVCKIFYSFDRPLEDIICLLFLRNQSDIYWPSESSPSSGRRWGPTAKRTVMSTEHR